MRLSQIARKVGTSVATITELLQSHKMDLPEGKNVKLNEEQVSLVYKNFDITIFTETKVAKEQPLEKEQTEKPMLPKPTGSSPAKVAVSEVKEKIVGEIKENVETGKEQEETGIEEVKAIAPEPPKEKENVDTKPAEGDQEEDRKQEVEVIRAKKIKLEGIKIVGKIDLPEPKPKADTESRDDSRPATPEHRRRRKKRQKDDKTPLNFEQKQLLEQKKRRKAKEENARKSKERKRKHFEEKIKTKQAANTTPKKKTNGQPERATEIVKKNTSSKATKSNWVKRFWKWLNDAGA